MAHIIKKIIITIVFLVGITTVIMPINISNASDLKSTINQMSKPTPADQNTSGMKKIIELAGRIISAVSLISGLSSIILIAYTGLSMTIGNTPEGKKDIKKSMIPIITGVLITFSATTIAAFFIRIFE